MEHTEPEAASGNTSQTLFSKRR